MKIAFFSDLFFPLINGITTYLLDTANLLSQKHQIVIFVPQPQNSHEKINRKLIAKNIRIEYLNSIPFAVYQKARMALPFLPLTLNKIHQFNPDIIHFHSPFTVGLDGIMTARILKIPLVGTFHGYFMEPEDLRIVGLDKIKMDNSKILNSLLWKYSNFHYNQADIVISPSEATKKDLFRHGLKKPVKIISNGINLCRRQLLYNFPLPKNKYFLYVGRISVEKNLEILIKAFAEFSQNNHENDLVIIGDGPAKDKLQALTAQLQITPRVHFLGMIERNKILSSNLYSQALAFVTASTSETQCISVLEAMSFGLPVIGVKSRALPELIKNNGLVCQPNNPQAIAKALTIIQKDQQKCRQYSNNSLKLIKQHDLAITTAELEKTYRQLITSFPEKHTFF